MNEIIKLWLIWELSRIQTQKLEYKENLIKLKNELEDSMLMARIKKWEAMIKELESKEVELKSKWLEILEKSGIDKFETDWVEVRKKTSVWRLIVDDENLIPEDYKETETITKTKINKKELKEDIKQWVIIEWCHLEQDIELVIKYL